VQFLGVAPTIIYLAGRREAVTIDGLGVFPKALSVEYLQRHHQGKLPAGLLRALDTRRGGCVVHGTGTVGTMRFGDVVAPTIELAERGFPMYRYLAQQCRQPRDLPALSRNAAVFFA